MLKTLELIDITKTRAAELLEQCEFPWQALGRIGSTILEIGAKLSSDEFDSPKEGVWISKSAEVFPTAWISAPCIIDAGTQVRHCAFIRGNALIGRGCVIGNSVELKNVIICDEAQVPHYNYVGDSILGYRAHMGAGSITSNIKSDRTDIAVKPPNDAPVATWLRKFGAAVGDYAEIGCNSVLNPGTIIGRNATIYPVSCVRGVVPADSIYKNADSVVPKRLK